MITVTIDGTQVCLSEPVTILDAARQAGIVIPTLCHHDWLEPYGGCRLCLVEVEKVPRLQTACTQYVVDGMVIRTESEAVVAARRAVLEFLLINHPLDCPVCDKAGECELQDAVARYGALPGRFAEAKRRIPESLDDPLISRNMERCISCARCVRMCHDIQGASAIAMVKRSGKTRVEPSSGGGFGCEYCGNCLTVCPVGALMSRLHRHTYRSWMIEREVATVCPFCAVACSVTAQVQGDSIVRVVPAVGETVNRGLLCNRGRFGYDIVSSSNRLTTPLVKKNGELKKATWGEALTFVAERFRAIHRSNGGSAIGGIVSGRATNEEAYALQKLHRSVLGNNNVDSTAALGYGAARSVLEGLLGRRPLCHPIREIGSSPVVLVTGGDPTSIAPVLGLEVRAAARRGHHVVTVGYTPGLSHSRTISLRTSPQAETLILRHLVSAALAEAQPPSAGSHLARLLTLIEPLSPEDVALNSGISAEALSEAAAVLKRSKAPSIVVGPYILSREDGHTCLILLACLAHLLGGRVYLLPESANERGVMDMGCGPDILPGGIRMMDEALRKQYEELSGYSVPAQRGLGLMEMIDAAASRQLKALYVMGEDLCAALPERDYVRKAIASLEFLVVQDGFLTETAEAAHVVLPGLLWAEQDGTFTNVEGTNQRLSRAVPGPGREGWRVISELSGLLGAEMDFNDSEAVRAEVDRLGSLAKDLLGTASSGEAVLTGLPDVLESMSGRDSGRTCVVVEFPLLGLGRGWGHSQALSLVAPRPYARLGKTLAEALSVADGEEIVIGSGDRTIVVRALIDEMVPEGIVMVPLLGGETGMLRLLRWRVHPVTRTPVFSGVEVTVRKVQSTQEARR